MLVRDLVAQLQQLPQDVEFVVWDDRRKVYVGIDKPQAVKLSRNMFDELVDGQDDGEQHVTIGLQD